MEQSIKDLDHQIGTPEDSNIHNHKVRSSKHAGLAKNMIELPFRGQMWEHALGQCGGPRHPVKERTTGLLQQDLQREAQPLPPPLESHYYVNYYYKTY